MFIGYYTFTFAVLKIHYFMLLNIPTPALPAPQASERLIFTHVGWPRFGEKSANFALRSGSDSIFSAYVPTDVFPDRP